MGRGRGKPIRNTTRLARMVNGCDLRAYQVAGKAGIPQRLLTEYLAGRKVIKPEHCEALCRVLDCKPEDIVEPNLDNDLTDSKGIPVDGRITTVKDLDMSHLEPYEPPDVEPFRTTHVPNVAPDRLVRRVG